MSDRGTNSPLRFKACRGWIRGSPTILINDRPFHGGFVGLRGGAHFLQARPEGVALLWQMVFIGPGGGTDWEENLVREFARVFAENPQAFGALVLGLRPRRDWIEAYPDEMAKPAWPIDWKSHDRPDASWASEVWLRDSVGAVERVTRILHSEFCGRVILYQIGAGRCGENVPQIFVDFSPPMLRHFRAWLRQRYEGDEAELRRCWGDPTVSFDTAAPPDHQERLRTEWFSLRSPLRRRTADYFEACADCVVRNALAWGEAVKRATGGESLYATPASAVLDAGLHYDTHGHLPKNRLEAFLQSPHLDFLESPASYAFRDLGRGDTTFMLPMGSVRLSGKMHLRDFDERTHLTAWKRKDVPKCRLWEPPSDVWGDVQLLLRGAAYSMMNSGAFWWHELEKGMFRLPEHVACARRLQQIGRGIVWADRRMPEGGLAVFIHPESNFLLSSSNRLIFAMNYEARQLQWAHAGMASHVFCTRDARHPEIPAPKVMMVTNAFALTTEEADAIKTLARRNRSVLIWLMAPGVQTNHGFDLEQTSRITGFKIRAMDVETLPRITLTPGDHPWSRLHWPEERPETSFGGGLLDADDAGARGMGPTFYAEVKGDRDVSVLGLLDSIHEPGLVAREMEGYTSVWCAAPYVHRVLLRAMGRTTGAHLYLETDDLIHATRELLLIQTRREGLKECGWPTSAEVVLDLYSGRTIAENRKTWTLEMKAGETRFLFAGAAQTAEQIRAAMAENRIGVELFERRMES